MRVLLINPPNQNAIPEYPLENFLGVEDYGSFPPLGLLYIAAYMEKHTSNKIFVYDCVAEKSNHADLKSVIIQKNPDLVGITTFTLSLIDIVKVVQTIKKISKSTHVCLGGHHAGSFPEESLNIEGVDSIIVGEGEITFTELAKTLENGKNINSIEGVCTKENYVKTKTTKDKRFLMSASVPFAYINDLNSLPFPARKFIKHINYSSTVGVSGNLATMISSRGCPYKCTFCDVPVKTYRTRSPGNIIEEMFKCIELGYTEIHFYDDLFNITPKKVIEFSDELANKKINIPWSFRGRVNSANHDMLKAAKDNGCYQIHFGVETGTDEGLRLLKKNTSTDQIHQAFKLCKKLKIKTVADFMIGLPFEKDINDLKTNIDFLLSLEPDYAQFSILTLVPFTQLYDDAIKKGLIKRDKWNNFVRSYNPDFRPDHWYEYFSPEDLRRLHKWAYKKFYFRPSYIIRSIKDVSSFYELKTKIKGAIKILG